MRDYELTLIFKSSLGQKELDKEVSEITKLLEANSAKIVEKRDPEKKGLAYEIAGFKDGFYSFFEFEADPAIILPLEGKVKLRENVIRHLIIKSYKEVQEVTKVEKKEEVKEEMKAVKEVKSKRKKKE